MTSTIPRYRLAVAAQIPNRAKISPFSGHLSCIWGCFWPFLTCLRAPRLAFPASVSSSEIPTKTPKWALPELFRRASKTLLNTACPVKSYAIGEKIIHGVDIHICHITLASENGISLFFRPKMAIIRPQNGQKKALKRPQKHPHKRDEMSTKSTPRNTTK